MQNEITKMMKLLDENGSIIKPGYAKRMQYEYNRENIKAGALRKKEWDFYQVIVGDWVLKLTIGNISYVAQLAAELFNVETKELFVFSRMKLLPFEKLQLPRDPELPSLLMVEGKDYFMSFEVLDNERHFIVKGDDKKNR